MTAKKGTTAKKGGNDTGKSYAAIIERIFLDRYRKGQAVVEFSRQDLIDTAHKLGVDLPKNIGDVVYSFRYRRDLPAAIVKTCAANESWYIFPGGHAKYRFERRAANPLVPRADPQQIKIPNATPEIIRKYALSDEQALLAIVRYNRLVDIFTGVTAYSLQNHLRTSVKGIGQIEVDELYIGVNTKGVHFVIPVQAKGRTDRLGIIQVWQDVAFCKAQFPELVPRPIGVQFMPDGAVAMLELVVDGEDVRVAEERHYRLVSKDELTDADLASLRARG
jgi:hypothetical protein